MVASGVIRGYRKKPARIYILGVCYFLLPFLTLFQLGLQVSFSPDFLIQIIFSSAFLFELFWSWSAGLAILSVTPVGLYYFLALGLYTTVQRVYQVLVLHTLDSPLEIFLISFWLLSSFMLLFSSLRIPYLNPKTQWWKQAMRLRYVSFGVLTFKQMKFPVVTLNLSPGGVFLKLDERAYKFERGEVKALADQEERRQHSPMGEKKQGEAFARPEDFPAKIGEVVALEIQLVPEAVSSLGRKSFDLAAEVVWSAGSGGVYRYALGLKFKGLGRDEKQQIKAYIALLKNMDLEKIEGR